MKIIKRAERPMKFICELPQGTVFMIKEDIRVFMKTDGEDYDGETGAAVCLSTGSRMNFGADRLVYPYCDAELILEP